MWCDAFNKAPFRNAVFTVGDGHQEQEGESKHLHLHCFFWRLQEESTKWKREIVMWAHLLKLFYIKSHCCCCEGELPSEPVQVCRLCTSPLPPLSFYSSSSACSSLIILTAVGNVHIAELSVPGTEIRGKLRWSGACWKHFKYNGALW